MNYKALGRASLVLCLVVAVLKSSSGAQSAPDVLDPSALKTMLANLGYEPKNISKDDKPKYEIQTKTEKFNVPVGCEISPSTNYIWLTVKLGDNTATKPHEALLKANAEIQPTQFYVTKSNSLMIGLAIEKPRPYAGHGEA
jgi:hypothetical protein